MGKKSIKANKSVYQLSREAAGLTREQAAEKLGCISESRIEKLESGTLNIHPEDVAVMAEVYNDPILCNYFCTHECRIGREQIPEVQIKTASQITLEMLASLNALTKDKERLIEIMSDGELTEDEIPDFLSIQARLDEMSATIESLKLWVRQTVASGKIDKSLLQK